MTREEEIQNYAYNNCINDDVDDTSYSLIVETAKWADETMIEKACDWLKEKNNMCMYELEMILGGNFIEDFKKAMEL